MTRKCTNPKHVGTPTDTGFSTDWCRLCGGVRSFKGAVDAAPLAVPVEVDEDEARLRGITW
jgi:hypothetical protein